MSCGGGGAEQELIVFRALLLRDRMEMDVDLWPQYTCAGAMHFLEISGLHVGLVLYNVSVVLSTYLVVSLAGFGG
ncbi:MAG: ComEC/Rec2 family competence protein [Flavobacteriales bacterium]